MRIANVFKRNRLTGKLVHQDLRMLKAEICRCNNVHEVFFVTTDTQITCVCVCFFGLDGACKFSVSCIRLGSLSFFAESLFK